MEEIQSNYEIVDIQEKQTLFDRLGITKKVLFRHISLFVLTFASIAFSGQGFFYSIGDSILFASLVILFLTTHEFGHYIAAVVHRVASTLPYFIPLPLISPIGTMGAVIRIKERIQTTKKLYDVGIAGPLAGFVVAITTLLIGFATLPGPEYAYQFTFHDDLHAYIKAYGEFPDAPFVSDINQGGVLMLGNTLLYSFLAQFFNNVPPMWEMYHYPVLFAGWLGLLFTALNLMPIGQLDGGHILYGLIGFKKHRFIARLFYGALSVLGGIGTIPILNEMLTSYSANLGYYAWAIWGALLFLMLQKAYHNNIKWAVSVGSVSLIITFIMINVFDAANWNGFTSWAIWMVFIIVFVKIEHPPVLYEQRLDPTRKILGWFAMALFILCISPNPLYLFTS
ncbi:site-2 protease family protein [bacterium]|nr:MAG: site-2 protease family protein [bacterium]